MKQGNQLTIVDCDNRDKYSTKLWINENEFINVEPIELLTNLIENNFDIEDSKFTKLHKNLLEKVNEIALMIIDSDIKN